MKIYQNLNKENVDSERREPATSDESTPQTVELTNISNKVIIMHYVYGNLFLKYYLIISLNKALSGLAINYWRLLKMLGKVLFLF